MIYLASLCETTNDKMNGYYMLYNKKELDKIVADNTTSSRVIIRKDFAQEFFTPSGLALYLENVKQINRNIIIELEDTKVMTVPACIEKLLNSNTVDEFIDLFITYPKECITTIHELCNTHKSNNDELLAASNKISNLQAVIDYRNKELAILNDKLDAEIRTREDFSSTLHTLVSRINYQYGTNIDKDKVFRVGNNKFDRIIYIKEITRVQYVDTLVYYLKEILKILYNMPTRLLVIEGFYAYGKVDLYKHLKVHYDLRESDVISGDILMLGVQPNMLIDILNNPSNISILIVLDRAGHKTPHIFGDNIEYFYTLSDIADKPDGVPDTRCISYSEDTLYIPLVEEFDSKSSTEKMQIYSSLPIVRQIVELLERS